MSANVASKPPANTAKMRVRIILYLTPKISERSFPPALYPFLIWRDKLTTVACHGSHKGVLDVVFVAEGPPETALEPVIPQI